MTSPSTARTRASNPVAIPLMEHFGCADGIEVSSIVRFRAHWMVDRKTALRHAP